MESKPGIGLLHLLAASSRESKGLAKQYLFIENLVAQTVISMVEAHSLLIEYR